MKKSTFLPSTLFTLILSICSVILGCSSSTYNPQQTQNAEKISGAWVLKARIVDGVETPATQRIMKLMFNPNGSFIAFYRGEESQKWVRAGNGGFSFDPPTLTLYWDSGQNLTLLMLKNESDRLLLHHGRNLAPLSSQEPDEVFVKEAPEKGPTK